MTRRRTIGLWMTGAGVTLAAVAVFIAMLPTGDCPPLLSPRSGIVCPSIGHTSALWLTAALVAAVPLVTTGAWLVFAKLRAPFEASAPPTVTPRERQKQV